MNKINYHKLMNTEIEDIKNKGCRPKLLLHSCCAPCSTYVLRILNEVFNMEVLFFNPNIYPEEEYNKRLQEQILLTTKMGLNVKVIKTDYESSLFYEKIKGLENLGERSERCNQCIALRLERTAVHAAKNEFDYFTSTLSISPLKNATIINKTGQSLQNKYQVKFLMADFKKNNGFKHSIDLSKKYNLYRQDYCGCIFSKKERRCIMSNKIETKCIHEGWKPKQGEPRQLPVYQSTTFKYDSSDAMGKLFDLEEEGYFYTRLQNPTNDAVAAKICALEGGAYGMLTSSGQAANFFAIFNICEAGDHFITSSSIYGGTYNLFNVTMRKMGIECTFVNQELPLEELKKYFKPNTKAVFGETITNPTVSVLDLEKFAKLAHQHGVPFIVDNTFATPINCRPFEWGADIVTHSTTKYIDGQGVSVGGCIIDSGNFDWNLNKEKFPGLTTPDDSYHGITYTERFGKGAYITKATAQLMRDFGATQSPQNAFYINLGLETLHLRMKRHCENALKVAEFLRNNEKIAWIHYPDLPGDGDFNLAKKYLPNGSCGVLAFAVKGGRVEATRFMDRLKVISIATHVADSKSCLLHPASHTHRQLTDDQLSEAGIKPDLIRLSVGIENVEDIINDLKEALEN